MSTLSETPLVRQATSRQNRGNHVSQFNRASRFLLWVDAVGGFLVCTGDVVRLGQAIPGSDVELPLQADVSRLHATIRRDAGGYVLEAHRDVRVNERPIDGATSMSDGCLVEFGKVQMRFSQPHPLSATARLDLVSHHQTRPSTTAVLLMAETCVLGPDSRSHVVCRQWTDEVVLARQERELLCRASGAFEIGGVRHEKRGLATPNCRVVGENFSLSLEQI